MTSLLLAQSFTPSTTAVAGNVFLTAVVGLLPLVVFFVLMGVFKVATHWCSIISLVLSLGIAVLAFKMPVGMALLAGTQGAAMGFMPIIYIIIAAVWLYNLTEKSGRSADLKAVFNTIGRGDQRAQALIVAWCFCGLLEGLAGFGAPVAIAAAMVATLGLPKLKAAVVVMVGNAINVGFGAMAIPTTTAGKLGGAEPVIVAGDMGHLTWIFCLFIPFLLLFILDGARGVRQLWPLAIVAGAAAGAGHFFTPSISYELTAVLASLLGLAASYVFLLVWTPTTPEEYRSQVAADDAPDRERVILALLPYVLVVVIIATTKLWTLGINLDKAFKATDLPVKWPGVYGQLLNAKGEASKSAIYNLQTLSNPGTWIFLTAIIVTFVYAARSVPGKFEMSVGKGFAVAVDDSGKVYAWGANEVGQLGKKTDEALVNQAVEVGKLPAAPTALVSGYEHTCALAKGTVWCFGSNRYGQVNGTVSDTPSGLAKVDKIDGATQIGTSGYDTWATVDKGTWTWGNNSWGQADPSQSVVNVAPTLIPASS